MDKLVNNEALNQLMHSVDISILRINHDGVVQSSIGKNIINQNQCVFDIIDAHSKIRLKNLLGNEKTEGTSDLYLSQGISTSAFFLKFKKEPDFTWLILTPYPEQYHSMVENMLDANSELTRLFEEKLSLEQELKIKLEQLRIASITDPLTKLYNRQYFYNYLYDFVNQDEWDSLSLIMIDFNDFKQVNDRFGHQTGDDLLVEFAEMIRKHCHMAFRFGGDEFVIVSVDQSLSYIKKTLGKLSEEFKTHSDIVTLSYGITKVERKDREQLKTKRDIDHLLNIADERMYKHKAILKSGAHSHALAEKD